MNYREKVILVSLVLGLGLVLFAAYAYAVDSTLFPMAMIIALIGGYIAFYPPSIFTLIRKLNSNTDK